MKKILPFFLLLSWPLGAWADGDEVIIVPYSQLDPDLPHPAHSGAPLSLKGIIRDARCDTYRVWWDINRDGEYDADDAPFDRSRNNTTMTVHDIGRTFSAPIFERNTLIVINVKVQPQCDNQPAQFGQMRFFVYAFQPSTNPNDWTADQVEIMSQMTIQEVLWYIHRKMANFSGLNHSKISATAADGDTNAGSIWAYVINGHMPAYPPSTIINHGMVLPDGWENENDYRWNNDPYAEDVIRMTNWLTSDMIEVNINANDEANTCEVGAAQPRPLVDTCDSKGVAHKTSRNDHHLTVYRMGTRLGGLAPVLHALGQTPLQYNNHNLEGRPWEWLIQQMVDFLAYNQIDGGNGEGAWYYPRDCQNTSCSDGAADSSTSQWAYIGLESAEIAGREHGVIVNNFHKQRISKFLWRNQRANGSAAYRSTSNSNYQLTGGAIVGSRWLGIHNFADENGDVIAPAEEPFGYGFSKQELWDMYQRYLSFTEQGWNGTERHGSLSNWLDGFWKTGNWDCGNTSTIYNAPICGNSYAIYSHQKGYRTGIPELHYIGNHDWQHEFSIYYIRTQEKHLDNYSTFGQIKDYDSPYHSIGYDRSGGQLPNSMGALVLTPTIFNPKPVAIGNAQPSTVIEGCSGPNNGRVQFRHDESFHPNPSMFISNYYWDVNDQNGLWWEVGGAPVDFQSAQQNEIFDYQYKQTGVYTATLMVEDQIGQTNSVTFEITVQGSENVTPSAAHGGPYSVEENADLILRAAVSDGNEECGELLNVHWDLNNDGDFNDLVYDYPLQLDTAIDGGSLYEDGDGVLWVRVPWVSLAGLGRGQENPNRIRMRAADDEGEMDETETTLLIYPSHPEAHGRVDPESAACGQAVQFDGSPSFHPNPDRVIAFYDWDFDGDGNFDERARIVEHTFPSFSGGLFGGDPIEVQLQVTDDLGRQDSTALLISIDQGNHSPQLQTDQAAYTVLQGDPLVIDALDSSDPDADCGDAIIFIEWDMNGNGSFADAVDIAGPFNSGPILQRRGRIEIPWDQLISYMQWPADRETMLPSNFIQIRITDVFGAQTIGNVQVRLFRAQPNVQVVQTPDPAPINHPVILDGRESSTPVPGEEILLYEWDLDGDGAFEVQNEPFIEFAHIFDPVPESEDQIPIVSVQLRVTDGSGRSAVGSYSVHYELSPPPTADADPTDPPESGYHIILGQTLTLNASQSTDPQENDCPRYYRWDIDYQEAEGFQNDLNRDTGIFCDQEGRIVEISAEDLASMGINAPGEYEVRLEVENNAGRSAQDSAPVRVYSAQPVAQIILNPNPAACGVQITLDARNSNHPHPDIDISDWRWDLDGDGDYSDANGALVFHSYDQFSFDGPIRVGLEVEDTQGQTGRSALDLNILEGNRPPVAEAGGYRQGEAVVGPYTIALGDDLFLDALGSMDLDEACGDGVQSYQWDLDNDGGFEPGLIQRNPTIDWAQLQALGLDQVGQYELRLRVVDRFGISDDDIATLNIVNGPIARAVATPARAGCRQVVEFSGATSSTDGPLDEGFAIVDMEWLIEGETINGEQFSRPVQGLPDENGEIYVGARLRITDASGRSSVDLVEVIVDVQNLAPVADAGGPYQTGPLNDSWTPVALDGRASSDPNDPCDEIVEYRWDIDRDGIADFLGATVAEYINPNWNAGTAQVIQLIVCDSFGVCSEPAEAIVEVGSEAPPTGEILAPRAGEDCINQENMEVQLRVSDPEGDQVTATIFAGIQELGNKTFIATAEGNEVFVNVDVSALPDGPHELNVILRDEDGAEVNINAGGLLFFDRLAPVISIGARPAEGACYEQAQEADIHFEDNIDPGPMLNQEMLEEGCVRTLRVAVNDFCGNSNMEERSYRIAQPPEINFSGPAEESLVVEARVGWEPAHEGCVLFSDSELSHNGAPARPYVKESLIAAPGFYVVRVNAQDCGNGNERVFSRRFWVNAAPTAISISSDHPARHPDGGFINTYLVAEGSGLQLDGGDSLPPEPIDHIASYRWDLDDDGDFDDGEGQLQAFNTQEDGIFSGALRASDSLGAQHEERFSVIVTDIDPIADAGHSYSVSQGIELHFDGTGSRALSAADEVRLYEWDFDGDGVFDESGADLNQPIHAYEVNGNYDVVLRVYDEDSFSEDTVRVTVADVNPNLDHIEPPPDLYEIDYMDFTVLVAEGNDSDQISRYEWDFDGDGELDNEEFEHPEGATQRFQYREARMGESHYRVSIVVRDQDSFSSEEIEVNVREITLAELMDYLDRRIQISIDTLPLPPVTPQQVQLTNILPPLLQITDNGRWGERYGRRGVSLQAAQTLITRLGDAQNFGEDFSLELWALSRQMKREVERLEALLLEPGGPGAEHPSMLQARQELELLDEIYTGAAFESTLRNNPGLAVDLATRAMSAYYWLRHAIARCNLYAGFPMPEISDPVARTSAAEEINDQLEVALEEMAEDLQLYLAQGGDLDPAPAWDRIAEALASLNEIRRLQTLDISVVCPEGRECISDEQALDLEILAAELARDLDAAMIHGAWVREWQSCLVLGLKFRIELSMIRVEHVCGASVALSLEARDVQRIGLDFVDNREDAAALNYYVAAEQQCLMIDIYDRCLAPSFPELNVWRSYPNYCLDDQCNVDGDCYNGTICVVVDAANDESLFCRYECVADMDCPERSSYCDLVAGFCRQGEIRAEDPRDGQCSSDLECSSGKYCHIFGEQALGECVSGCRTNPSNCFLGGICDPVTHTCAPANSCLEDEQCDPGFYCDGERCRLGCRIESCGPEQSCNLYTRECQVQALGATCASILDNNPLAESGVYMIDPDGLGGEDPFAGYCDMQSRGGGWLLVMNRSHDLPITHRDLLLLPEHEEQALNNARWSALRLQGDQAMASYGGTSVVAEMQRLRAANCTPLADDLSALVLAHDETEGCNGIGGDYSNWFGVYDQISRNTFCNNASAQPFYPLEEAGTIEPAQASMWVRSFAEGSGACEQDEECDAERFCHLSEGGGLCLLGCRPGVPGACLDGEVCHPETHNCEAADLKVSCLEILNDGLSWGDGFYLIDPNGGAPDDAILVRCIMESEGGGWTQIFDERGDQMLLQRIPDQLGTLQISEVMAVTVQGLARTHSLEENLNSLGDAFAQEWLPTGFESDRYRRLSQDEGDHESSLYIFDDHDIRGCAGRQSEYVETPQGLISYGYSNGANFGDAGSCTYQFYTDIIIDRLYLR